MNQVALVGNLTKDPELRYLNTAHGQKAKCRFTVAVNEGENRTSYIPVVAWDRTAENCEKFLKKGSKVAVGGRIQTGSYEKRDGSKAYTTDVVAFNVEFLSRPEQQEPRQESFTPATGFEKNPTEQISYQQYQQERNAPPGFEAMAKQEDVPF